MTTSDDSILWEEDVRAKLQNGAALCRVVKNSIEFLSLSLSLFLSLSFEFIFEFEFGPREKNEFEFEFGPHEKNEFEFEFEFRVFKNEFEFEFLSLSLLSKWG